MPARASGAHAAASRAPAAPACGPNLAPRARWHRELRLRCATAARPEGAGRPHVPLQARVLAIEPPPWATKASLRARLLRALAALARRLDAQLDTPIRTGDSGGARRVTVLEVAIFQVRRADRTVTRARRGRLPVCFQLVPFLSSQEWRETLLALLDRIVLADDGPGPIGPMSPRARSWVAATLLRLLRGDARFRSLRDLDAPRALGVDPQLACIAMLARLPRGYNALSSEQYGLVWSHEEMFRRVARENPQLLPLVTALLLQPGCGPFVDPVHALARLVGQQVSPKAWRYVAGYGSRFLRPGWAAATRDTPLEAALAYLGMLDDAGLPPPPPRSLARAWMTVCRVGIGRSLQEAEIHGPVPLAVLSAAARRHDAARANPGTAPQADTVIAVADWYRDQRLVRLGQATRDWAWLENRWREHDERARRMRRAGSSSWTSLVGSFQHQRWRVQPLLNAREAVDAALALRNCLDRHGYINHMRENRMRVFVVRNEHTARVDAAIAIVPAAGRFLRWDVSDVRGFANSQVPHFLPLAQGVARCYTRAARVALAAPARERAPRATPAGVPRSATRQLSLWGDADDDFAF